MSIRQLPFVIWSALSTFARVVWHFLKTGKIWSPEREGAARLAVCRECQFYDPEHDMCAECWCVMADKTSLIAAQCPLKKW